MRISDWSSDVCSSDLIHSLVTGSIAAGAKLAAGGTYEDLFYRPTVLADTPLTAPAFADEVFGPVAPVTSFATVEQAVAIANDSEIGRASCRERVCQYV